MRYLLDTDITNYLVKGIPAVKARFREALARNGRFILCPAVHLEATRYLKLKRASHNGDHFEGLGLTIENWAE